MPCSWKPPHDPDRPNCPYFPGFESEIEPHTPSYPFGGFEYPDYPREFAPQDWLYQATQTQVVLNHPPVETEQQHSTTYGFTKARLVIDKSISIGNGRGPQLALCTIKPQDGPVNASPFLAMAKIYDGLYYPFVHSLCAEPQDVCLEADGDYSREAAAYEQLTVAKLTGDFAPMYYGSWTMNLSLRAGRDRENAGDYIRPVRLILMEAIQGSNMRDMFTRNSPYAGAEPDAFHYSESYRLDVIARILDGETRQFHAGVRQHDLYPRNVILVENSKAGAGTTSTDTRPRVILIDYNRSLVFQRTIKGLASAQKKPLPQNPLERHKHDPLLAFAGWVPESWHFENEEAKQIRLRWFEETFCGDKAARYEPMDTEEDSD